MAKPAFNEPIYYPKTVVDIIDQAAIRYGDLTGIRYFQGKKMKAVSFKRYKSDIVQLAQKWTEAGFRGKHVVILGESSYVWIVCFFSLISCGAVVVPTDQTLDDDSLNYIIEHSDASCVMCDEAFEARIHSHEGLTILTLENIAKEVQTYTQDCSGVSLAETYQPHPEDIIEILYTSGTGGTPKGVLATHKNIVSNVQMGQLFMKGIPGESNISFLPLYHAFSIVSALIFPLYAGTCTCVARGLKHVLEDLKAYNPITVMVVPLIADSFYKGIEREITGIKVPASKVLIGLRKLLLRFGVDPRKKFFKDVFAVFGNRFDYLFCGGSRLSEETEQGLRNFGVHIINSYGLTECTPGVSCSMKDYWKLGSVGVTAQYADVRIDPETSEIQVSGPNVSPGYYKNDALNKERFVDGWLKTGDRGHFDEDGFLFFDGRLIDNIVLHNGENVDPAEIEQRLKGDDPIEDILVYRVEVNGVDVLHALVSVGTHNNPEQVKDQVQSKIDAYNATVAVHRRIVSISLTQDPFVYTSSRKLKRKDTQVKFLGQEY